MFRLLVFLLAVGCASPGTRFDWNQVDALTPGMTVAEVGRRMGKPNSVATLADGRTVEMWLYSTGTALEAGHAPSVGILFDRDGRMVRVLDRSETDIHQLRPAPIVGAP